MSSPTNRSVFGSFGPALLVTLLIWTASAPGWGQTYSGSFTGLVTDPSNAVIPGAPVSAVDVTRGFTFATKTDESGRYILRALPPSTYRITIEAPGFATFSRDNLVLEVNQNVTLNITLNLTGTTETINVTGAAPLLATQDAVTGQVLTNKFVNDLPLLGRSVMDLAFLAPGVTLPAGLIRRSESNNFISSGTRNATADVLVDGVTTTTNEINAGSQLGLFNPTVDSVQEFKVMQGNYSAEFGFSGSALVNMVSRSGTNRISGSAWEFLRNDKLNANNWFNNANRVARAPARRNVFGFVVGGPVVRDRTFFFVDFEGQRHRTVTNRRAGVPSAAMRMGDFREICAQAGGMFDASGKCTAVRGQLWDPFSGQYSAQAGGAVRSQFIPFNNLATYMSPGHSRLDGTGYQLPRRAGNLIDPVAQKIMNMYPLPNVAVGQAGYDRFNNWIDSGISTSDREQWGAKIDHRLTDSALLSGKFSTGAIRGKSRNAFGNVADPFTFGPANNHRHVASVNYSHTLSPRTMLTLTQGYFRYFRFNENVVADFPQFDPIKDLGLPTYMLRSGYPTSPGVSLGDYASGGGNTSIGAQGWSFERWGSFTHHTAYALSRMQGRHELKFGGEMRARRLNYVLAGRPMGNFNFSFSQTSQMPTTGGGDAMASFLIGFGSSGEYDIPIAVSVQSFQHGWFLNDNWRLTDRLTLNLGVRYELDMPRTERYNRMSWIDTEAPSPLQVAGMDLKGGLSFVGANNRTNYDLDRTNFAPRAGLAYRLRENTVIRTGYGIYYLPTKVALAGQGSRGFAGFYQTTAWITTLSGDGETPWGRLSDPFPITGPQLPPGSSNGLLTNVGYGISGPIRDWNATPYEQAWSFGVQHQLPGQVLVDASYVGKKGTKLYFLGAAQQNRLGPEVLNYTDAQITALNQFVPNPFYGVITALDSSLRTETVRLRQLMLPFPQFTNVNAEEPPVANSIYNSFQLRVEKRLSRGLEVLATYTFSKSIDDSSTTVSYLSAGGQLQDPHRRFLERSVSGFDTPQVLQFSYVYQLPFGRGRPIGANWRGVLDGVLGGWQTNGIWRFDNGQPLLLGLTGGQHIPTYGGQRPNLVERPKRNTGPDWMTQYFANPGFAVKPPRYTNGDAPRTLPWLRRPGTKESALSVFKSFSLAAVREGMRLEYRVEAFNAFNTPQFGAPNTTVGHASFGRITSQSNSPREVQMALKLYW